MSHFLNIGSSLCKGNIKKDLVENIDEVTCLNCINKMETKPTWYITKKKNEEWEHKKSFLGHIPLKPVGLEFKVNEKIIFGGHQDMYIKEIFDNGQYYKVSNHKSEHAVAWHTISKMDTLNQESFVNHKKYNINYSNTSIEALIAKCLHFGTEMNPSYQRDYVWEIEDKISLIDSIFNDREIGRFVFIKGSYSSDVLYEVVDGKQRLDAIIGFYSGLFQYRGKYFYELHRGDKRHFKNHPVAIGSIDNISSLKDKIELFVSINDTGKIMDKAHLEKMRNKLNELE